MARNDPVFKNNRMHPVHVVAKECGLASEFLKWNSLKSSNCDTKQPVEDWPNMLHFVQVDAGVYEEGIVAMGCVIKDRNKVIIMASCRKEEIQVEPLVVEVMAIRWAIQLEKHLKLHKTVFQFHALVAVDCVNSVSNCAVIEPVAFDCRDMLREFSFSSVVHFNRSCNVDAHKLVGLGKLLELKTSLGGYPQRENHNSVLVPSFAV